VSASCNVCGDVGTPCVPFVRCVHYPEHEAGDNMLDPACDGCGIRQSHSHPDDLALWVTVSFGNARHMHRTELCADCALTDRSENL